MFFFLKKIINSLKYKCLSLNLVSTPKQFNVNNSTQRISMRKKLIRLIHVFT